MLAAAAVALVERLAARRRRRARAGGRERRRGRLARPRAGRDGLAPRSSATGRRSTASSATSDRIGVARGHAVRLHDPAHARTRSTTGSRSSRTTTAATSASTAPSRAACTRTTPSGPASSTPTTCSSPLAYRPEHAPDPLRRPRRRLGAEADVARLPGDPDRGGRARPRGRRRRPTSTSSCRATRGCRSRSRTAAASSPRNDGPWDAIVIDAFYSDSIPFHLATREFLELARSRLAPGRRRLDEHHRRRPRRRLAPLPLDAADVPRRLPDGRDPSRARGRASAT